MLKIEYEKLNKAQLINRNKYIGNRAFNLSVTNN